MNTGALQYHSAGSIPVEAFKEKLKIGVNPSRLIKLYFNLLLLSTDLHRLINNLALIIYE